jgi:hypothetical protein
VTDRGLCAQRPRAWIRYARSSYCPDKRARPACRARSDREASAGPGGPDVVGCPGSPVARRLARDGAAARLSRMSAFHRARRQAHVRADAVRRSNPESCVPGEHWRCQDSSNPGGARSPRARSLSWDRGHRRWFSPARMAYYEAQGLDHLRNLKIRIARSRLHRGRGRRPRGHAAFSWSSTNCGSSRLGPRLLIEAPLHSGRCGQRLRCWWRPPGHQADAGRRPSALTVDGALIINARPTCWPSRRYAGK